MQLDVKVLSVDVVVPLRLRNRNANLSQPRRFITEETLRVPLGGLRKTYTAKSSYVASTTFTSTSEFTIGGVPHIDDYAAGLAIKFRSVHISWSAS